jgi:CheY-like chemotaxis protein
MSGKEGLAYLRTCDSWPDLVLLDCMMPGVSGFDVIGEMRRTFPNVHLPIIMISASIKEEHIIKVRQGRVERAGSGVGQHALAQQPCRHCPSIVFSRFYQPLPALNAPALPRRAWTWARTTTFASPSAATSSSHALTVSSHGPRRACAAHRQ